MADKRERAQVKINDFQGIVEASDPDDLPSGASRTQVNVATRRLGLLQTRRGFLPVPFEVVTILTDLTSDQVGTLLDEAGLALLDEASNDLLEG